MSMPTTDPAPRIPPTFPALLGLAWPMIVSRATQVVVGIADGIMVAHLGAGPLAATTTGAFNSFALLIFPMGVVFIISSFVSQLFGKGDLPGARRYGHYGLVLAVVTQLFALLIIAGLPALLGLFPYEPSVRASMEDYLRIRLWSTGAVVVIEALGNYYGGIGNTRLPMLVNLVTMVFDLLGNWLLIDGHWGAPALGVRGAAWSSTIGTWIGAALVLAVFLRERPTDNGRHPFALYVREFKRMLRFGVPSGFNWFFEFFAFNFYINVVVAGLGTTALAAMMSVIQINSVSFMPAFALASAGSILVGQAIGASAKDDVPRLVRMTMATAATWMGLVGVSYLLMPAWLLTAFSPGGAEGELFRHVGVRLLMMSAAWQLFDATAITLAEALRAAGDTAFTLWVRLFIAWLIFVPGSYVTVRHMGWGDVGVVFWLVLYLVLLALVLYIRFKRGAWRNIQLTEPPPLA